MTSWEWGKRKRQDDEDPPLKYCKISDQKLQELERQEERGQKVEISCQLTPRCSQLPVFHSVASYEDHFVKMHQNKCFECARILPTQHLLHLHLLEVHDSYFKALASRQDAVSRFKLVRMFCR